MSNIILINDNDQEETLVGVDKLVVRGDDGDVEFAPPITVEPITITTNGTTTAPDGKAYSPVTVNIPTSTPELQEKSVTIISNGTTEVTPDDGKDGLSKVTVTTNVSSGGGTRKNAVLINGIQLKVVDYYFLNIMKLLSGTSPDTVQLYIDAPKAVNLEIFRTIGALQLSGSGKGAYKTAINLQSDVPAFTMTELDENTNRYMIELSVEYDASKVDSLSSGYCYALCQYTIDGVYSEYRDGEYVLFGPNAAKSLTMIIPDIDGHAPYSVYDLREDMGENLTMCRMARSTLKKVYCPKGVTLVGEHAFFRQPNLELVDFSLAESVPTLYSGNFSECGDIYQIKVPAALYDEWISAKNWSSVASHIVAAE